VNKIGFKNEDTKVHEEIDEETPLSQDTLDDILNTLFTQPEWLGDYEQTLFWACVFNTQNKEHQC
jgi:hypothetical protein